MSWDTNVLSGMEYGTSSKTIPPQIDATEQYIRNRKLLSDAEEAKIQQIINKRRQRSKATTSVMPALSETKFVYRELPKLDKEFAPEVVAKKVLDSDSEDEDEMKFQAEKMVYFGQEARQKFFERNRQVAAKTLNFESEKVKQSADQMIDHIYKSTGTSKMYKAALGEFSDSSPRTKYLSACTIEKLVPMPVMIRKKVSTVFDFSHQGLGDACIIQFARSLADVPHVQEINVCDNRLSDNALHALLSAILDKPNLKTLNISMNEVGDKTSQMLLYYLSSSMSTIEHLILEKSDIDDNEAASFMSALEKNKSVTNLNLSRNRIGEAEALNFVQPDFKTGGEAVGEMLNINLNICRLDLSWNSIRLESACTLAESLKLNYNLVYLNLSYNACGDPGAMAFGSSLSTNKKLEVLDLSYNNIGIRGAMVIASALSTNKALQLLKLNGNSFGKDAGRALIYAISSCERDIKCCDVEMAECNLGSVVRDTEATFDPIKPEGEYELTLSDPYDRMIAMELLRTALVRPGCRFAKLSHTVKGSKPSSIKLVKPLREGVTPMNISFQDIDTDGSGSVDATEFLTALQKFGMSPELDVLEKLIEESDSFGNGTITEDSFSSFLFRAIFAIVDEDQSGNLDIDELKETLSILGMDSSDKIAFDIIRRYDFDNSGTIEIEEYIDFMQAKTLEESARNATKRNAAYTRMLDASNGQPWILPQTGVLNVVFERDIECEFEAAEMQEGIITNVIKKICACPNEDERMALLDLALDDSGVRFTEPQASQILESCNPACRISIAEKIMPHLTSPKDANKLICSKFNMTQRVQIRQSMKSLGGPTFGNCTRRYCLDLLYANDRAVARKLAEIAYEEKEFSKNRSGRGDTSQHGNWENFRNETLNGEPIILTVSFFSTMPSSGTLEFDYVSTIRPHRGASALSERRFKQLMTILRRNSVIESKKKKARNKWGSVNLTLASDLASRLLFATLFMLRTTKEGLTLKILEIETAIGDRNLTAEQVYIIGHSHQRMTHLGQSHCGMHAKHIGCTS